MALLGFDAVGRFALGQIKPGNAALSGNYTITGVGQAFNIKEAVTPGAFAFSAPSISFSISIGPANGAFALNGVAQTAKITEHVAAGSYVITGSIANNLSAPADAGAYLMTGINTQLVWTGAGVDTSYTGGIGHFLEEIERQKQLAAITRKVPGPIDRRTVARFAPITGAPSAPAVPAPDMAAISNQRMAEAAAQAKMAKRRRDEEALLLLAS